MVVIFTTECNSTTPAFQFVFLDLILKLTLIGKLEMLVGRSERPGVSSYSSSHPGESLQKFSVYGMHW